MYRARTRSIDTDQVRLAVIAPEKVIPGDAPRRIHMRRFTEMTTGRLLLIRVVVEETSSELIVITLYVTSKISKYLGE